VSLKWGMLVVGLAAVAGLAVAVILATSGSDDGSTSTTVASPPPPAASEGNGAGTPASGQIRATYFYTPSHNIACAVTPEKAFCDTSKRTWKPTVPKPSSCDLGWGPRVGVDESGTGEFACVTYPLQIGSYGVLPDGKKLSRGGISCLSEDDGVTCVNSHGGGFFVSQQRVKFL
jgi:hypothetical protein